MANAENLVPFDERTESEQREIRSKGGKASGETRRRKKAMRQAASMLLNTPVPMNTQTKLMVTVKELLGIFGYDEADATYQDALLAGIMLEAMKGDVRAAEFIRDTVGENPALAIRKQELQLRKSELKFKQEQAVKKTEDEKAVAVETAPGQIDLSKVTDEELEALNEITGKLFTE